MFPIWAVNVLDITEVRTSGIVDISSVWNSCNFGHFVSRRTDVEVSHRFARIFP